MGCKLFLFNFVFIPTIAFIAALIYLPPSSYILDIEPVVIDTPFPDTLDQYKTNVQVKSYEKLPYEIAQAESLGFYNGRMVTACEDGYVYEVKKDQKVKLVKVVSDEMIKKAKSAGIQITIRPLGVRFDSKGNLWVTEPSFGVFQIQNIFNKPKVNLIFDIDLSSKIGKRSLLLDDAVVIEKPSGGYDLYITDISQNFHFEQVLYPFLSGERTGRVLKYDTDTKKVELIAGDLNFPNGIEVLHKNTGIIFSEMQARSIWKYMFNEKKLIKVLEGMPSETDNIRASPKGDTYWLALSVPRTKSTITMRDRLNALPFTPVKKFIFRTFYLIGRILETINQYVSCECLGNLAHEIKTMLFLLKVDNSFKNHGMIVEIDENGKILTSLIVEGRGDLELVSEVREIPSQNPKERVLYLGTALLNSVRKLVIVK